MEPRLVGAGDDTEERSREEDESEGDCGNVAMGGGGDGCTWAILARRASLQEQSGLEEGYSGC